MGSTSVPIEDDPTGITPINYQRTQLGTKAVWRPFGRGFGLGGLAINGGYEYSAIHRVGLEVPTGSDDPPFQGTIIEENTTSNIITIGPSVRWSPELDTYLRYKWCNTQDPLFATNSYAVRQLHGPCFEQRPADARRPDRDWGNLDALGPFPAQRLVRHRHPGPEYRRGDRAEPAGRQHGHES